MLLVNNAMAVITATIFYLIFIYLYKPLFLNAMLLLAVSFFIYKIIMNLLTDNNKNRQLLALTDYIGDIKHYYHATGMVSEAFYEADSREKGKNGSECKQIYNLLNGAEPEKKLNIFYSGDSNRFVKILAGFSYLVYEYGDRKINGVSVFIKNLNYLIDEINIEVIKNNQITFWLKGLNLITIIPVVLIPLVQLLVTGMFPVVNEFYNTSSAFYIQSFLIFSMIISYIFINQMQKDSFSPVEKNLYKNKLLLIIYGVVSDYLQWLSQLISPSKHSNSYKRTKKLIENSGMYTTVEMHLLIRKISGLAGFFAVILMFSGGHEVNRIEILNNVYYGSRDIKHRINLGNVNEYSNETAFINKKITINDRLIIEDMVKNNNDLEKSIKKNNLTYTKEDKNRVLAKFQALKNEHITLKEIFMSLLAAFLVSLIPLMLMYFKSRLRHIDMEDEVFQFHTIIILLMHHRNVDVQTLLQWLLRFSNIFRAPLEVCLSNFNNPSKAFEKLEKEIKFKPLLQIIDNLKMASEKITIEEAFDSLELDRDFYRENRKETNRQTVSKKIELGQLIGFIPVNLLISLYLVLPVVWTSFKKFDELRELLIG